MRHDGADPPGWRNQSVVREPDPQQMRWSWRVLLGLVVAVAPSAVYVVQQNECLQVAYELEALDSERERLTKEEQRLKIERARLESLEEIERWALRERGLRRPDGDRVIVVRGEPQTPREWVARAPVDRGAGDVR